MNLRLHAARTLQPAPCVGWLIMWPNKVAFVQLPTWPRGSLVMGLRFLACIAIELTPECDMRRYAFCMVFHVRWIFLTMSLRIPADVTMVGFGDECWEIPLTWKTMQNAFARILYTLRHFNQAKYTVQSCRSWKPCEMDLSRNCSLHGGMSEVCENVGSTVKRMAHAGVLLCLWSCVLLGYAYGIHSSAIWV